ncbi:hypothetical protein HYX14_00025 [Candidatus Woesearchaeota archaeon]|nr:hypothetical protein [Candidatus Woesearchaeota archaeon]
MRKILLLLVLSVFLIAACEGPLAGEAIKVKPKAGIDVKKTAVISSKNTLALQIPKDSTVAQKVLDTVASNHASFHKKELNKDTVKEAYILFLNSHALINDLGPDYEVFRAQMEILLSQIDQGSVNAQSLNTVNTALGNINELLVKNGFAEIASDQQSLNMMTVFLEGTAPLQQQNCLVTTQTVKSGGGMTPGVTAQVQEDPIMKNIATKYGGSSCGAGGGSAGAPGPSAGIPRGSPGHGPMCELSGQAKVNFGGGSKGAPGDGPAAGRCKTSFAGAGNTAAKDLGKAYKELQTVQDSADVKAIPAKEKEQKEAQQKADNAQAKADFYQGGLESGQKDKAAAEKKGDAKGVANAQARIDNANFQIDKNTGIQKEQQAKADGLGKEIQAAKDKVVKAESKVTKAEQKADKASPHDTPPCDEQVDYASLFGTCSGYAAHADMVKKQIEGKAGKWFTDPSPLSDPPCNDALFSNPFVPISCSKALPGQTDPNTGCPNGYVPGTKGVEKGGKDSGTPKSGGSSGPKPVDPNDAYYCGNTGTSGPPVIMNTFITDPAMMKSGSFNSAISSIMGQMGIQAQAGTQ